MNYEKKYKESLERAKEQLDGTKVFDYDNEQVANDIRTTVYNIFPELKESDGEKIRKQIISFLKEFEHDHYRSLDFSSWIAWLEKQSNKSQGKSALEAIKEEKIDNANGVEPKFHEGDWVVSKLDKKTRRISEVHCDEYNKYYIVEGKEYNIEEYDRLHHLWTIEDANDGDVLCLGDIIAIFKMYIGQEKCICYCSFCDIGGFEIPIKDGKDNVYGCTDTTPATKEQRELLLKRMNESGYIWDADKKELIKL